MRALLSFPASLYAAAAMAQTAAPPVVVVEPTLGERLGGWLPFLIVLIVAIGIYQYRKRRAL